MKVKTLIFSFILHYVSCKGLLNRKQIKILKAKSKQKVLCLIKMSYLCSQNFLKQEWSWWMDPPPTIEKRWMSSAVPYY